MDSSFVIISDSSCDLNKNLRERFDIADYVPGHVTYPDGHTECSDLDWTNTTPEEYFSSMSAKKAFFKTSTPSIGECMDIYERQLSLGKDILAITLSTGISGTYGVFVQAAKDIADKYPDRRIVVVDSLRYSTSLALLCVHAARLRREGKTLDETAQWLEQNKECIHQIGWMDDLFYCKKMGRVSNVAAVMGTLVGIKAMADFNHKGLSNVIGKTRGYKNAYSACIEYMKKTIVNPEEQIVFVAQTLREKEAEKLSELIREQIKPKEIIMTTVGQSCGPSIGPGLVATFYYGNKISENLADETKILDEIIAAQK